VLKYSFIETQYASSVAGRLTTRTTGAFPLSQYSRSLGEQTYSRLSGVSPVKRERAFD